MSDIDWKGEIRIYMENHKVEKRDLGNGLIISVDYLEPIELDRDIYLRRCLELVSKEVFDE
tara:strand:+ start:73 stop:255 length:183 start_codon:yes stop_codon:yes gene_type:complete